MEIYIARGEQQTGPFSEDQITSMLKIGMVTLADSAWHQDMEDWKPLHCVLNLPPPISSLSSPPANESTRRSADVKGTQISTPFWPRAGAYVVDYIASSIAAIIIFYFYAEYIAAFEPTDTLRDHEDALYWTPILTMWLYYALFESSAIQATPGKKLFKLIVTDLDGSRLSFWQATGRFFGMALSYLSLGYGFLMCIWTKNGQCYHDQISKCLVLRDTRSESLRH